MFNSNINRLLREQGNNSIIIFLFKKYKKIVIQKFTKNMEAPITLRCKSFLQKYERWYYFTITLNKKKKNNDAKLKSILTVGNGDNRAETHPSTNNATS